VGVGFFANDWESDTAAMNDRPSILSRNLAALTESGRRNPRARSLSVDRTLQTLVADLVAARTAACMTQEDIAARMGTTKSVVSRLESGVRTRPTMRTIERYAAAVGASVEIRVRKAR
jgi:ribosome-binding protein aMBF1 (putative translation factor)